MLILTGVFAIFELVADKIPAVDHIWDSTQTFFRPIAGIVLAIAAVGEVDPGIVLMAGIVGGGLATGVHTTKSAVRLLSTSTTGGIGNPFISLIEDILVIIGTLLSLFSPIVMVVVAILFVIFSIWFLPKFWSFVVFRFVAWFSWFRWIFAKSKLDSTENVQLYCTKPSKLSRFENDLQSGEKLIAVLSGQVWLDRRRKNVWLVLTDQRVLIVMKRMFAKESWSYNPTDIIACHYKSRITATLDLTVTDQTLLFEFFKSATPYVAFVHERVQSWID